MKTLNELENSMDISDREEYAQRLKGHIAKWESELPEIEKLDDGETKSFNLKKNKEAIKNLKTKLSNYDIYKQKFSCRTCQEVECICYEANRSNESVPKEFQQSNEGRQSGPSQNLAEIRGTVGNHSNSIRSGEDIKLPF